MASFFSKLSSSVRQIYRQAEGFIEEERDFAVSELTLNATLERYVTNNVRLIKDLHADLHDDWLTLYATVDVAGIYAELSVDLKLVQMLINKKKQLLVFEQVNDTQIIAARFDSKLKKIAAHSAIFAYRKLLGKDVLGPILQKYRIVEVKHGLLYLDLGRWLNKFEALRKFNINHAECQEQALLLHANVNLAALLNRQTNDDMLDLIQQDQDTAAKQNVTAEQL